MFLGFGSAHMEAGLPHLTVNFDPALVCMLREVRYFLQQPNLPLEIPAAALRVTAITCLSSVNKSSRCICNQCNNTGACGQFLLLCALSQSNSTT